MAGWGEKFSKMTQSAVNKSKEVAEITKLTLNNNSLEAEITTVSNQIGEYVVANQLLTDDEIVSQKLRQIDELKAAIAANEAKIREIKNINVCPACGAEVPNTSNFCDKCGSPMKKDAPVVEEEAPVVEKVCVKCGTSLETEAAFCPNCGEKCE
ncbi:MAG: zinc ribbon domain-containing protein [Lachnospiraceae bacterium]|nr:zinc ribbon domain-containing protein [Lachnospiraceae bacterium]